jgi:hypothetical protein
VVEVEAQLFRCHPEVVDADLAWQTGVASGCREAEERRKLHAVHVGRRQGGVEELLSFVGADEILARIGRRRDLVLLCLSKIRTRRAAGVDDALRQQV